jgi:chemotaxis protein methyltransferase CheR
MNRHDKNIAPSQDIIDDHILTQAIIDTIREPLIVLDERLRIVVASRSFYKKFNLTHKDTHEKLFYDLGNGQWDIPAFRILLEKVIPEHANVNGYEVEHHFPDLGLRTMIVNAREIRYENDRKKMLLSIFDITDQRELELEKEKLLMQKDLLLKEMRHRVANSLQLIASILLLKAEIVDSKTREHLEDAHERIMLIASVQQQLDPVGLNEEIEVANYLTTLCKSIVRSMIGGRKPITVAVQASAGAVSSDTAVSFGLIVTELVINTFKHAFPDGQKGRVVVTYDKSDKGWVLSVSDDGIGSQNNIAQHTGLGTSIVGALANQLHAIIRTESSPHGMKVSLIYTKV